MFSSSPETVSPPHCKVLVLRFLLCAAPTHLLSPCYLSVQPPALSNPLAQPVLSWRGSTAGAAWKGQSAPWLLAYLLVSSGREFALRSLLQVKVWWIWTCPCTQTQLSTLQHQVLAKLVWAYLWVLLHTRRASFQQLPELMSDSTHNRVYKFFSASLISLHRYPVDFAPGRGDNHQLFSDNTPTSNCTFPLPCSHWDWPRTKHLCTFDLCLHNRNSLFSERLEPSHQLQHRAAVRQYTTPLFAFPFLFLTGLSQQLPHPTERFTASPSFVTRTCSIGLTANTTLSYQVK